MFLDIQQTIRRNSTNLSLLMSELCLFCVLSFIQLILHLRMHKKFVMLIGIGHKCVALKRKKTD